MSGSEKLLYKGPVIKPGDLVKATDVHSGKVTFYRVVRVWGSHGVFRVITDEEAGPNPIVITVQPEAPGIARSTDLAKALGSGSTILTIFPEPQAAPNLKFGGRGASDSAVFYRLTPTLNCPI